MKRKLFVALLLTSTAGAALGVAAPAARAGDFTDRPVKVVVPFPAGGAADNAMRVIGKKRSDSWKQQVLVENSAGVHAIKAGASAPPDGYSLLLAAGSLMVTGPLMRSKLPYHPQRDFMPIGRLVTNPPVLVLHPSLGAKSVKDLIAPAKTPQDGISADLQRALADPEVERQLIEQGNEPAPTPSAKLAQITQQDTHRWSKRVKERNLKIED